ncbi:Trp biosynthesis-associated membrane protein [Actinomycetospora cinnamomea]|uniref:Putative membrane protein (TIGR02234 family) n=1 Tax=Actinomycetospora cinnamomea TaxID=663609 RepID=A0A2U1FI84_9PSEU|nr:Trp biosynthesis-associated membrane protein [Actinomycetospora cinnamomea]PVZ11896.1 putative membrane protein (TIGR02234 family) [Actinomycetospora cinnamomea]
MTPTPPQTPPTPPTPPTGPRAGSPGRLLGAVVVLLVVAAAVLWGASRATWVRQVVEGLAGSRSSSADGATAEPILVPWALLCLAAVGGLLATAGWGRRVVGTLVAVAGLWAVLRGAAGLVAPASAALPVGMRPGDRPLPPEAVLAGPVLGVVGGLLMLLAGLLTARYAALLPRLGARYDAPVRAAGEPGRTPSDPDRALWEALDEGRDPTGEHPADPGPNGPGGRSSGRPDGVGGAGGVAG